MSIRLYIGNLPKEIDRKELQDIFAEAGDSVSTKVITDRKTGKCRGFGFVTVKTDEEADQLIEKFNGYVFQENALKIEKALPRAKGKGEEESAARPAGAPAAPTPKASGGGNASESKSGGGSGSSDRRRGGGGNNKSRRNTNTTSGEPDAIQPDPRWANALEELKQRLAAQTTN